MQQPAASLWRSALELSRSRYPDGASVLPGVIAQRASGCESKNKKILTGLMRLLELVLIECLGTTYSGLQESLAGNLWVCGNSGGVAAGLCAAAAFASKR